MNDFQDALSKAKVAVYSFDSLGDGLIYLMMTDNLYKNGYDVTLFGHYAYQLRNWLPQLKIKPYPSEPLDDALQEYDLVIMSPPQALRDAMSHDVVLEMREKWLLICQKTPEIWHFDHTEKLKNKLPLDKFQQIERLANASGSIRYKHFKHESVVDITLAFMQEKMHLGNVSKLVDFSAPSNLRYRRYQNRIVVSPDSASPQKKDWYPKSFIRLCFNLKAKGYVPVIVVAPKNYEYWHKLVGDAFDMPKFQDIGDLAAYIYESGALIANDSGNGHLASFLNIPVVTLYRKRNPMFHWRPDWRPAKVVCPLLVYHWREKVVWRPFITVGAVLRALREVMKTANSTMSSS